MLKERLGYRIDTVIDINPAKQGKFLAGTGLQIESPEKAMTKLTKGITIYVMNSNYLGEVKQMTNNSFNYIGVDYE